MRAPIDLDQMRPLDRRHVVGGTGVLRELTAPSMSLRDYAALMVVLSDNTATNVLIDARRHGEGDRADARARPAADEAAAADDRSRGRAPRRRERLDACGAREAAAGALSW